jgi:hypothetical protein
MNTPRANTSSVRYVILAMLFGFSFVTYLERINISIASELMMPSLSLTKVQMGQIFSSFLIGYAIFQLPTGILGDTIGPKLTLAAAGLLWGIITVLTGFIPGLVTKSAVGIFLSLWILRFLLGLGRSRNLPGRQSSGSQLDSNLATRLRELRDVCWQFRCERVGGACHFAVNGKVWVARIVLRKLQPGVRYCSPLVLVRDGLP